VGCAPRVQDGCQKWILWQRRKRCRFSWCGWHAIGQSSLLSPLVGHCALAAAAEVDAALTELEDVELTTCAVSDRGVVTETVAR